MGLRKEFFAEYRRDLAEFMHKNFSNGATVVYLAYNDNNTPDSREDATLKLRNYITRIKRLWNNKTDNPNAEFKYFGVTETSPSGKLHHHVIFESDITTEELVQKWTSGEVMTKALYNDAEFPEIVNHISKYRLAYRHFTSSKSLEKLEDNELN